MSNTSPAESSPHTDPSTGESTNKVESPVAPGTEGGQKTPEYVSKEEVAAVLKRMQDQSVVIAKLQKKLDSLSSEPKKDDTAQKPDPTSQAIKRLEEEQTRLRQKEERHRAKLAKATVKAGLLEAGVQPAYIDDLADLLVHRHVSQIQVDEDDNVSFKQDEISEPVSMTDWLKAFTQTDKGRAYLPPKKNPASAGFGRGNTGVSEQVRQVTQAELNSGKVSLEDVRLGKVVLVSE